MDAFPKTAKKILVFLIFVFVLVMKQKKFRKIEIKKVYFKGNIKLINQLNYQEIKNINENILLKKGFGLQQAHKRRRNFLLKNSFKNKGKI